MLITGEMTQNSFDVYSLDVYSFAQFLFKKEKKSPKKKIFNSGLIGVNHNVYIISAILQQKLRS